MKSPFTGKEMVLQTEKRTLPFRKEEFEVVCQYWYCEETEEEIETEAMVDSALVQVYNAYRAKHNLPFPEEVKAIREQYDVSAHKMSVILGFGPNQYKSYEDGEIPSKSNANLILLAKDPRNFRTSVQKADIKESEKKVLLAKLDKLYSAENAGIDFEAWFAFGGSKSPSIRNGYRMLSLEKVFHILLYFANKAKPYKTKLNKLFFYMDFNHFRMHGSSISGLEYRAIEYGPVPDRFDTFFNLAEAEGYVRRQVEFKENYTSEQFLPGDKLFDFSLFTGAELASMNEVIARFKDVKVSEIVALSHDEEGWIQENEKRRIISYEYSFELKHI